MNIDVKTGGAMIGFLVVIYLLAEFSPKGAAALAAILGLLLYTQVGNLGEQNYEIT